MASKKSKMASFAHRNDQSASAEWTLDSLKVATPPLPQSRSHEQARGKVQFTHRANGSANNARGSTAVGESASKHFYDTDGSSIDKDSTIASVEPHYEAQPRQATHQQKVSNDATDSPLHSDEEYETDPDEHLADDPLSRATHQKRKSAHHGNDQTATQCADVGAGGKPRWIELPYMKGDSYPTTTDGVPSVSHAEDRDYAPQQYQGQDHISDRRQPPQRNGESHAQGRLRSPNRAKEHAAPATHTLFRNPAEGMHQINSDFQFAQHSRETGQAAQKPSVDVLGQVAGKVPSYLPQHPEPQRRSTQHQKSQFQAAQASYPRDGPLNYGSLLGPQTEGNLQLAVPDQEQRNDSRRAHSSHSPQRATEQETESGPPAGGDDHEHDLDIDPPALYSLEYADLRSAKFDQDPRASRLPKQEGTLAKDLQSMLTKETRDQMDYFSTLNIVEWEEAGDWFLGRYGEIVTKLRTARQEKRKAARSFEDEIEARHEAVNRKRQQTEAALADMKASGAQVLQATPQKAKKTK